MTNLSEFNIVFSSSTLIHLNKDVFDGHFCHTINNFNIVSAYAPQVGLSAEEKDYLWHISKLLSLQAVELFISDLLVYQYPLSIDQFISCCSGGSGKLDESSELYIKAANSFKMAKKWAGKLWYINYILHGVPSVAVCVTWHAYFVIFI